MNPTSINFSESRQPGGDGESESEGTACGQQAVERQQERDHQARRLWGQASEGHVGTAGKWDWPTLSSGGELGERDRASRGGATSLPQLQRGSRRMRAERIPERQSRLCPEHTSTRQGDQSPGMTPAREHPAALPETRTGTQSQPCPLSLRSPPSTRMDGADLLR